VNPPSFAPTLASTPIRDDKRADLGHALCARTEFAKVP
jgi:hypothetical protein